MMESSGDITTELIEQMLREGEKDSSIVVQPDLVVADMNEDLHGGSHLSRVTANYSRGGDGSSHTLSLIIKVAPDARSTADEVKVASMFSREIQALDEVLPRMSALLARTLPDHKHFYPRAYYTRKDPGYMIALEDLAVQGFEAVDRKSGLDLEHCRLALRTLARFHAASLAIHAEDEGLFTTFDEYFLGEATLKQSLTDFCSGLNKVVRRAVESWSEFGPGWAERLRVRYDTLVDDLGAVWKRDEDAFNVLNHGDFGLHNLMFRHCESSGEPEAVMMVDFQCCSYNSPVLDLHQFLYSSATDEVRADHTDELLREYHAELTATLEALGAPKNHTISYPQLLQEFENKMLYGFFYATSFQLLVGLDADGGKLIQELLEHGGDSAKYQSLVSDNYAKSLKRLLPIFSQKQLL